MYNLLVNLLVNLMSTSMSTSCQPHVNLHVNLMSTSMSTSCQPPCQPLVNLKGSTDNKHHNRTTVCDNIAHHCFHGTCKDSFMQCGRPAKPTNSSQATATMTKNYWNCKPSKHSASTH